MMNSADSIFRKSSLDRIRTPEQLNEAIKGTSAGFLALLIAIIIFILGFLTWGILGTIEETVDVAGIANGGKITVTIPSNQVSGISTGIASRVKSGDDIIQGKLSDLKQFNQEFTAVITYEGNLTEGEAVIVTLVKDSYPPYKLMWR